MGFIEETGAAQHLSRRAHRRDLRRHQRHPGDRSGDAASCRCRAARWCAAISTNCAAPSSGATPPTIRRSARPARGLPMRSTASTARPTWLLGKLGKNTDAALAGATPYLRLFGNAAGGCMLAERSARGAAPRRRRAGLARRPRALLCREHRGAGAGPRTTVTEGADSVNTADAAARGLAGQLDERSRHRQPTRGRSAPSG